MNASSMGGLVKPELGAECRSQPGRGDMDGATGEGSGNQQMVTMKDVVMGFTMGPLGARTGVLGSTWRCPLYNPGSRRGEAERGLRTMRHGRY